VFDRCGALVSITSEKGVGGAGAEVEEGPEGQVDRIFVSNLSRQGQFGLRDLQNLVGKRSHQVGELS